jgi:hypothetical protein
VTLKRFRRSGRVVSAINAEPTPAQGDDPGWEYLMLAHEIRALCSALVGGLAHQSTPLLHFRGSL